MVEERVHSVVPIRVYHRKVSRHVEFNLPEELLIEILKCLPVETLIRFTSVSKSWFSLITNPSFVSAHVSHQSDPRTKDNISAIFQVPNHFFLHRLHKSLDQWTEFDSPGNNLVVPVAWCHGVVCLFDYFSESVGPLILWNPSIRKTFTIQFKEPSFNISGFHIKNSRSANFTFGFGFDPISWDYKVVRLVYNWDEISNLTYIHSDVCSLNKGGWRSAVTLVEGRIFRLECRSVYLNGVIHWMCLGFLMGDVKFKNVLKFDLADEKIGQIHLPDTDLSVLMSVKVVEDKLAVTSSDSGGNIWVMEEYGESKSWRKLLNFYLGDSPGFIRGTITTGDGKTVVATSAGNWILWDCPDDKLENLALPVRELRYMNSYVPSLVLLRCENRVLHCGDLSTRKRRNQPPSPGYLYLEPAAVGANP